LARNCQSGNPIARPHVKLKAVVPDRIRPIGAGRNRDLSDRNAAEAAVRVGFVSGKFGPNASCSGH
jgi:hypothetical protein